MKDVYPYQSGRTMVGGVTEITALVVGIYKIVQAKNFRETGGELQYKNLAKPFPCLKNLL